MLVTITFKDVQGLDSLAITAKIQTAIDAISKSGGGRLILQAGVYHVASLELRSHLTITLEAGATLSFSNQINQYPLIKSRWEGVTRTIHRACLYGDHIEHTRLTGEGTIDGNGIYWWHIFRDKTLDYPRPYLCSIEHSQHIKIDGLSFINSPAWTLHPYDCNDISIRSISIINPKDSPNTDGIDPESCQNVRISDCFFDVGDDCIAIKAGTEVDSLKIPCKNVTISGCNMTHGHGGVVLGSEMSGDITNVVITNCTFHDTDRGIRFKTRRGRGGKISEISINNITMDSVLCPLVVTSYYYCGPKGTEKYVWTKDKLPVDLRTPTIKNILFTNIIATNIHSCAAFIYGLPESPIKRLMIKNSIFSLNKLSTPIEPAMIADAPKLSQAGIFIENTEDCSLTSTQIINNNQFFVQNKNNLNLELDVSPT